MTDIDTQKPLESLRCILQDCLMLDKGMDLPRTVMLVQNFRALSLREKTDLIASIGKTEAMFRQVMRALMEDAINRPSQS